MALNNSIAKVTVEDRTRVKEPLLGLLNQQIVNELASANLYKSMACWLDLNRRFKFSGIFLKYGQEEMNHMDKIITYLFDRNSKGIIGQEPLPPAEFTGIRDVMEKSLEHEIQVTTNWELIANTAKQMGDNTTYFFSQWFINEQVEEENKFRNALFALDNGTPDWYLELNWESIV